MKIERVSCTQFAGIRNYEVSFDKGINVLLGKNETGKSTIVDLIYQLLYHDVNAKLNEKNEKDFRLRYFPKGIKVQGDFVDGSICLMSEEGEYTLEKCWGEGAFIRLTTPQSVRIQSQDSINKTLAELLRYRKGLYDDIVFAPQRRQENMVANIFQSVASNKKVVAKGTSNAKTDLIAIIAQETIRNAGVDANAFEQQLGIIIDDFEGCWDVKKDVPKTASLRTKKNGGKPKNEGKLFLAYFEVDQLRNMLSDARKAEVAIDRDMRELHTYEMKLQEAEKKRDQFEEISTQLAEYNANIQLIAHLKEEIKRRRQAAKEYPGFKRTLSKATKLRQELREVEALDLYDKIAEKRKIWETTKRNVSLMKPITGATISRVERLEEQIFYAKREKYGMDILAQLQNIGFNEIVIKSLVDGRIIMKIKHGYQFEDFSIIEPVEIIVPGQMTLRISDHVNGFTDRKSIVDKSERELENIYCECGVFTRNIKDLRKKKEDYNSAIIALQHSEEIYKTALGNRDWNVMDETFHNMSRRKKRRPISDIKQDISELCAEKSIESYCGELTASINAIEDAYRDELGEISADALRSSVAICQEQIEAASNNVKKVSEIPNYYKRIKDVSEYRDQLKGDIDSVKGKMDEINSRLQENQKNLGKKSAEEYEADLNSARIKLDTVRRQYAHWLHIRDVFRVVRERTGSNTEMKDVEKRFSDYLSVITNGRVVLNSLSENMDVEITSDNNRLDENILSEGTKDTISLAFRLAMMEHVFPNGDGLLVLDDPFTDMDDERAKQACSLVRKFAEKGNQVIFTTCNPTMAERLGGNTIQFS